VYVLGSREHGWYKIGMASDVEARCKNIQALNPFAIEIIASWTLSHTATVVMEAHLHTRYARKRIRGEWFSFTTRELEEVLSYASSSFLGDTSDTEKSSPR